MRYDDFRRSTNVIDGTNQSLLKTLFEQGKIDASDMWDDMKWSAQHPLTPYQQKNNKAQNSMDPTFPMWPGAMPTAAQGQNAIPRLMGTLAGGGSAALHYLLPAMFTGSQSSSATPASNNATATPPAAPVGPQSPQPQPGSPVGPMIMHDPGPSFGGGVGKGGPNVGLPLNLAPPNPGPTANPTLPLFGGGPSNGFGPQGPVNPQQQPGLIPRMVRDAGMLKGLFSGGGGSVGGANALLGGLY